MTNGTTTGISTRLAALVEDSALAVRPGVPTESHEDLISHKDVVCRVHGQIPTNLCRQSPMRISDADLFSVETTARAYVFAAVEFPVFV